MRKLLLLLITIMINGFIMSQKETIKYNEYFKDPLNRLVLEKVMLFDSINKEELINRFENWGGQNFRNYSEVRTSKTNDQITLLYITSFSHLFNGGPELYIIMNVQFKDNKLRISVYDDGNVFRPGYYSGNIYVPSIPARSSYLIDYFDSDGILEYKPGTGSFNMKGRRAAVLVEYKEKINGNISSIEKLIKEQNKVKVNNSDW